MRNITIFDFSQLHTFTKIYVLVSGGYDSTYLYEMIRIEFPEKTYPVNCYNPYETSQTLTQIQQDSKFIQIKPEIQYNYGEILRDAFLQLPYAKSALKEGRYNKKIFGCCYYIKHKAFLNNPLFKEENTVVISGIKAGDGNQRNFWCHKLRKENTFFHKHLSGQLYCYPFRDYEKREFPKTTKNLLKKLYPKINHSGCSICPVLVLFGLKKEKDRYYRSVEYAQKLGILPHQKTLLD